MCQVSNVIIIFFFGGGGSGGPSFGRVCYQQGLPRLVSQDITALQKAVAFVVPVTGDR